MILELLQQEEREQIERRASDAFARGVAECELEMTWADPRRPADGSLTALDAAYDAGRAWGRRYMLEAND